MNRSRIIVWMMAMMMVIPMSAQRRKAVVKKKPAPVIELTKEELLFEEMLDATQQVMFIDSVVVDKTDFLNVYNFTSEAGNVTTFNQFFNSKEEPFSTVYVNQLGNKCWYASKGRLYTSDKLGSQWSEPILVDGLGQFQRTNYPFMLSDGTTLYFAAISDEGLGGLDIYVSRYNSEQGKFLLAENLGLPFNSDANDYMYAVDEFNGIGFFATDRRQPEGKVCIYTFIPNQKRLTYSSDEYDKATVRSRAKIERIADTWGDGALRVETLDRINNAGRRPKESKETKANDFAFVINDFITYTSMADFRNAENRNRLSKLNTMKKSREELKENIEKMRTFFATKADILEKTNLRTEILDCEEELFQLESDIRQLEKAIRYAELQVLQ